MKREPYILDCLQHSDEWHAARRGRPTASQFHRIVTAKGKIREGQTPDSYRNELVYQLLFSVDAERFETWAMRRGTELEPHARAWYELATGREVKRVGFVYGDASRRWGCSPDGIVEDEGGIEIKCPNRGAFVAAMEEIPDEYYIQAQGQMWILGANWWDLVIYTEEDGNAFGAIHRLFPDPAMFDAFERSLPAFSDSIDATYARAMLVDNGIRRTGMRNVTLDEIAQHLGPEWAAYNPDGEVDMGGLE